MAPGTGFRFPELSMLAAGYARALLEHSSFRPARTRDGVTDGVVVTSEGAAARIDYIRHGEKDRQRNDYSAEFVLQQMTDPLGERVIIHCPAGVANSYRAPGGAVWRPFVEKHEVLADLKALCEATPLRFSVEVQGAFKAPRAPAEVLERLASRLAPVPFADPAAASQVGEWKAYGIEVAGLARPVTVSTQVLAEGSTSATVAYRASLPVTCRAGQVCVLAQQAHVAGVRERLLRAIEAP